MPQTALQDFFLWSLVVNYGILLVWFAAFSCMHDFVYRLHGRWFKLSPETFDAIHYAGLAVYKILVLVFNLVPFLVLLFLG